MPNPDQPGTKLRDLKIRKGKWTFSEVFRDLLAAREWGFQNPEDFWDLPIHTQALIIAFVEAKQDMMAFEDQVARSKTGSPDPKFKGRL